MHSSDFSKAIIAGDACVDVHVQLDVITGKVESTGYRPNITGGGTSANVAVALRKLGIPTAFMGTIGNDYGGHFILQEFESLGIDTQLTVVDNNLNTVNVFAFIDSDGERHLWGFPRDDVSYSELNAKQLDLEKIKTASWLHSTGMSYFNAGSFRDNMPAIFKAAYEAGVPTSFDLNTRVPDPDTLEEEVKQTVRDTIPYVKYLLGSGEDEFRCFGTGDTWQDCVRSFAKDGRCAIARMGAEGSFTVTEKEERYQRAYEVKVVNTTGAGDSFNAGFISAMLEGENIFDAVDRGNAVAGYKVSGSSSRATPDREQLREFIEAHVKRKSLYD